MTAMLEEGSSEAVAIDFVDKSGWSREKEKLPAIVAALATE
jgi:hypothetical protein